jgi:hypothetical protein
VSRHAGRDAQDGQQPDAEVAATTTAIAGLRRRLRRPDTPVKHPAVRRELRKLGEELAALLEQPGRMPGRHRSQIGKQDRDACEPDLKPDPAAARTAAEYISVLWRYRAWHGDPSWRKMAARARHLVVHSTIYDAMHGHELPSLDVVRAVILGCGGGEDDLAAFIAAWRRIKAAAAAGEADERGLLPAPVPTLELVLSA